MSRFHKIAVGDAELIALQDSWTAREHADQTYYFCAAGCQKAFEADPAFFVTADSQ